MPDARPAAHWPEALRAPSEWRCVDIISDLHLQPSEPATFDAWRAFLRGQVSGAPNDLPLADALFILGDLFEVWVGDDVLSSNEDPAAAFWRDCADALAERARLGPVYFMAGNRDFLLGPVASERMGWQILHDPTVLSMGEQRTMLSHGDALCIDDTDYQAFRRTVRQADWQSHFLSQSLSERLSVARDLRKRSQARKDSLGHDPSLWADVDHGAAEQWLLDADARVLIHGHTHRPGQHAWTGTDGHPFERHVLSDWELSGQTPRCETLRLHVSGELTRWRPQAL
ncbi:UDP-2,3-diacylglucosamine hydrolase [Burkholderiaceae bacterium]